MTDYTKLAELAREWKERDIDYADLTYQGGSTSINKLMRHYIEAASPDVVLALIAERDLYHEALWKACGDDEVHVNAYLEAVKP